MKKLQIDVPDERLEELQALMRKCDINTYKDLFNNAMTLLEWAARQSEDGRMVASVDEQNMRFRELSMPILDRLRPTQAAQAAARSS
jgi:hypothetical protein